MASTIVLTAVEPSLVVAWQTFCGDLDSVRVHRGSILDVECDAVVSPANSFGFMDGGIDALYLRHFGRELEERVQKQIIEHHHGELLVGAADIIETGSNKLPYLIVAPTMRVPMRLGDSVNPYLAARAILLLIRHGRFLSGAKKGNVVGEHVSTVAIPGLGTGVGQISPTTCARQVRAAIEEVMCNGYKHPSTWAEASERHQLLYTSQPRRLQ